MALGRPEQLPQRDGSRLLDMASVRDSLRTVSTLSLAVALDLQSLENDDSLTVNGCDGRRCSSTNIAHPSESAARSRSLHATKAKAKTLPIGPKGLSPHTFGSIGYRTHILGSWIMSGEQESMPMPGRRGRAHRKRGPTRCKTRATGRVDGEPRAAHRRANDSWRRTRGD